MAYVEYFFASFGNGDCRLVRHEIEYNQEMGCNTALSYVVAEQPEGAFIRFVDSLVLSDEDLKYQVALAQQRGEHEA